LGRGVAATSLINILAIPDLEAVYFTHPITVNHRHDAI